MAEKENPFFAFVSSLANLAASVAAILTLAGMTKDAEVAQQVAEQVPAIADAAVVATKEAVVVAGEAKEALAVVVQESKSLVDTATLAVSSVILAFTRPFTQLRFLFRR